MTGIGSNLSLGSRTLRIGVQLFRVKSPDAEVSISLWKRVLDRDTLFLTKGTLKLGT
jgi:hypothetical protein